jgi:hypothetical protein
MAEVAGVYDATPAPRTPADVLPRPPGDRTRRPYPRADGKRLTESITDTAAAVIAAGSHEAERRDPDHRRPWIALIDVDSHQIDRINAEPHERKTNVTILIDLIHLPPARSVTWEVVAAGRLLAASVPGCGTGLVRVGPTRGRRPHCGTLYWLAAPHQWVWRRDVAQLGSALDWGSRGRGFKSRRPDQVVGHIPSMDMPSWGPLGDQLSDYAGQQRKGGLWQVRSPGTTQSRSVN